MLLALPLAACGRENTESAAETNQSFEQNLEQTQPYGKTAEEIMAGNKEPEIVAETEDGKYVRKSGIKSYLFIGVDDARDVAEIAGDFTEFHQCDTLLLYVVDEDARHYNTLSINRDTVATMDLLDAMGNIITQTDHQIEFAYSYTAYPDINSENVVRAVSRLLGDIDIDGYVTMGYSGIPYVNDVLGGVEVTIEDDFSQADSSLVMGETVNLMGEQALHYLRSRMNVGDGGNPSRMRRQQTYLTAFSAKLKAQVKENSGIINAMLNAAKPYMVSNLSMGSLSNTLLKCANYSFGRSYNLSGVESEVTYVTGNTHTEFSVEQESIDNTVLELYYTKQ